MLEAADVSNRARGLSRLRAGRGGLAARLRSLAGRDVLGAWRPDALPGLRPGRLLAVGLGFGRRFRLFDQTEEAAQLHLDLGAQIEVLLQELADVLAPLPETRLAVREPGAALVDQLVGDRQIDEVADARDAGAVQDVELGDFERRRRLVLDHLDARAAADVDVARLDLGDAADVQAHRGVELEGAAAAGGLRVAEHDADLLANLADEDETGLRARHDAGQLAQGLRHAPRLQARGR